MKRIIKLFPYLFLTLFAKKAEATDPPNIVFVLIDDMGWSWQECYGNNFVKTPNIDRLAREGIKFTDAYAMPQCSPSRFTLITGQYSARTNMNAVIMEKHVMPYAPMIQPESIRVLPIDAVNIGKVMRKAGYHVGHVGKWHFDVAEGRNRKLLGSEKYLKQYGFDKMIAAENIEYDPKSVMSYTNATLNYLASHQDQPVFAYLAHHTVHTKLDAPEDLIQKYVELGYEKSPDMRPLEKMPTANILAMIEYLDQSIGRLMDGIEALKLKRETLVIYMSDNGGHAKVMDSSPLRRGKGSEYEGGVRVPLIMHWPESFESGRVIEEPVHIVDLFPTFMELTKGEVDNDYILDGKSLVPLMLNKGSFEREAIYMNTPLYIPHYNKTPSCFIRMGDYKLIKFYGDYLEEKDFSKIIPEAKIELYNLRNDISEQYDLSESMPERASEMEKMLNEWLKETGAKMPVKNENFNPEKWSYATSHRVDEDGNIIPIEKR